MARFDVTGLEQTIKNMEEMGEASGEVAKAMLMAAAGEVRTAWQDAIVQFDHIGKYKKRKGGEMLASVGFPRRPKSVKGIMSIDIYPQGVDSRGVRNAEKAFIAHYGRVHQTGTGFVDVADENSTQPVYNTMTTIWDEFLETGKVPKIVVPNWHAEK